MLFAACLLAFVPAKAEEYVVRGPQGPVLLIHGSKDKIVPLWCSEKFLETYDDKASLTVIPGENHTITKHRQEVVRTVVEFCVRR